MLIAREHLDIWKALGRFDGLTWRDVAIHVGWNEP